MRQVRLVTQYPDGVGLLRCDWCLHPALRERDAELLRTNLSAIIAEASDPRIGTLAREALAVLQEV